MYRLSFNFTHPCTCHPLRIAYLRVQVCVRLLTLAVDLLELRKLLKLLVALAHPRVLPDLRDLYAFLRILAENTLK